MADEPRRRPRRRRRVLRRAVPSSSTAPGAQTQPAELAPADPAPADLAPAEADPPGEAQPVEVAPQGEAQTSAAAATSSVMSVAALDPDGDETGASAEDSHRSGRSARTAPDERGLRDLVGAGPSQVGVSGALRARDVDRPSADDLARAEHEVVLVRRHWKPPS
jgi:hypothetical protein